MRSLLYWPIEHALATLILAVMASGLALLAHSREEIAVYPDPAPATVEVLVPVPGSSAIYVERMVTTPLEVALASIPGLRTIRSKSLFGLAYLNFQFDESSDYAKARGDVSDRLALAELPPGVLPQISPRFSLAEIYRYTLAAPRDADGQPIYKMTDLKTLQNWVLRREFRRLPRVADVVSFGGEVKRYEVQPDPDAMKRHGITLAQLQSALAENNANVSGEYLIQGETAQVVRALGLLGLGRDPMSQALAMTDPLEAGAWLRAQNDARLREIRDIVLASPNYVPVRIGEIADRGLDPHAPAGVVVGHQTRLGEFAMSRPARSADGQPLLDADGQRLWTDDPNLIQGLIYLIKGESTLDAIEDIRATVKDINGNPGRILPGVSIDPYYDRAAFLLEALSGIYRNYALGFLAVFLTSWFAFCHLRAALVVTIHVFLTLLLAHALCAVFSNPTSLLSIGVTDFGVLSLMGMIVVGTMLRHLWDEPFAPGDDSFRRWRFYVDDLIRCMFEVARHVLCGSAMLLGMSLALVYLLHFFTPGPEAIILTGMSHLYSAAACVSAVLALTVTPALARMMFWPTRPHVPFLIRRLQSVFAGYVSVWIRLRYVLLPAVLVLGAVSLAALPLVGREFVEELDEGHIWIHASFPLNSSLDLVSDRASRARTILRAFPEVEMVASQIGRPDEGTDPTGFGTAEFFLPLAPRRDWPRSEPVFGWRSLFGQTRQRTREELIAAIDRSLREHLIGINWSFSQLVRNNVLEVMSGMEGENMAKIFGPDLDQLEQMGEKIRDLMLQVPGVEDVRLLRVSGQSYLEFPIDRRKCAVWNTSIADVENAVQTAVGGKWATTMIEGDKSFDVTIRWPERLRADETAILNIPIDVTNQNVASASTSPTGSSAAMPAATGTGDNAPSSYIGSMRRRLRDFVTPIDQDGNPDPHGSYVRPGPHIIYREQGKRFIGIEFSVRGRQISEVLAELDETIHPLLPDPYRLEWSGACQELLKSRIPLRAALAISLVWLCLLLYFNLHSFTQAAVVAVYALSSGIGIVWTLLLTENNLNSTVYISFISVVGIGAVLGALMAANIRRYTPGTMCHAEETMPGLRESAMPVIAVTLTAFIAMQPAVWNDGVGTQAHQLAGLVVASGVMALLLFSGVVPALLRCLNDWTADPRTP